MILSVRPLAEVINSKSRIVYYDDWYGKKNVYYYDSNGKKWYIKSFRNSFYTWTKDPLYARHYTEKTAVQHLNRINSLIKEGAIL